MVDTGGNYHLVLTLNIRMVPNLALISHNQYNQMTICYPSYGSANFKSEFFKPFSHEGFLGHFLMHYGSVSMRYKNFQ